MIDPADITVEAWRTYQEGGQHVAYRSSGVMVTHAAGITVCVDIASTRHKNKAIALDAIEGAMTSPHWR
ncbi:peptide chain release factor-like protein [Azospirillum himalayense]|uniref:Peptide chain release factor-like protein n=1 Tax=Azospirillum himalayense TaxID=654847 RepID=A0ABW0FZB5_9PROT